MTTTTDTEKERLEEIRRILPERARLAEQLAAIDRRIAELAGAEQGQQCRPGRKTFTRTEFARGCGL